MVGIKRFGFFLLCTAFALLTVLQTGSVQAQEMTYDEYKIKLAEYEKRTAEAKKGLAECKQAGEELTRQLSDLDAQIASTKDEIYKLTDCDQACRDEFFKELDKLEARLAGLAGMSEEALFEVREEVDGIEARIKELKAKKVAFLPDVQSKLRNIDRLWRQVKDRMPRKRIKPYTVVKGDCLWNIAKKPEFYSDPYLWPRIYVENRSLIKDPDLIYPNWKLGIPIGVDLNQHLVLKGHSLSRVAGIAYKDATKWHSIYQANKAQILDPNLIFPAQVLDIPAN